MLSHSNHLASNTLSGSSNKSPESLRFMDRVNWAKGSLNLASQNLTDEDIPDVLRLLQHYPQITSVNLRANRIGPQGAKDFAMGNKVATTVTAKLI